MEGMYTCIISKWLQFDINKVRINTWSTGAEICSTKGELLLEKSTMIINQAWTLEIMPSKWNETVTCPIYKKVDRTMCTNYRVIALLDIAYKIMAV